MCETKTGCTIAETHQLVQVGVCSLCNGPAMMPSIWHGIPAPTPTCSVCGAVEKPRYLRVIEMMPAV
jgi:hypothetical protein